MPDKSVSLLVTRFELQVWGYLHLTSLTTPFKALQWIRSNRENIKVALQDVTKRKKSSSTAVPVHCILTGVSFLLPGFN